MTPNCIFCKSFYFRTGQPAYSEWTPGGDAEMGCQKSLMEIDFWDDDTDSFRKALRTAETCPEFGAVREYMEAVKNE